MHRSLVGKNAHSAYTKFGCASHPIFCYNACLAASNPDNEVLAVEWVPLDEAITRLEQNDAQLGMQEPPLAYLRGEISAGAMWTYREANGQQLRFAVVASAHQ